MNQPPDPATRSQKMIVRVSGVMRQAFPQASASHLNWQAEFLVGHLEDLPQMFHHGGEDKRELERIERAAEAAEKSIQLLSDWSRDAMGWRLLRHVQSSVDRDELALNAHARPPVLVTELERALRAMSIAARETKAALKHGRPKGATNWKSIAATEELRRCWEAHTGQKAPKSLGETKPKSGDVSTFNGFYAEMMSALEIHGDRRSQMDAWRTYTESLSV